MEKATLISFHPKRAPTGLIITFKFSFWNTTVSLKTLLHLLLNLFRSTAIPLFLDTIKPISG